MQEIWSAFCFSKYVGNVDSGDTYEDSHDRVGKPGIAGF